MKATFTVTVEFDPEASDPDKAREAVGLLIDNALMGNEDVLDDFGNPTIGEVDGGLAEMLRQPDTDDAHYLLREVYKHMNVPLPAFLEK